MKNIFIISGTLMLVSVLTLLPQSGFTQTGFIFSKSELDVFARRRAYGQDLVSSLLVRVQKGSGGNCSGMLIAPKVVLTAKHCRPAEWIQLQADQLGTIINVVDEIQFSNDIALLVLESPAPEYHPRMFQKISLSTEVERHKYGMYTSGVFNDFLPNLVYCKGSSIVLGSNTLENDKCPTYEGMSGGPLFILSENSRGEVYLKIFGVVSKGNGMQLTKFALVSSLTDEAIQMLKSQGVKFNKNRT